MLGFQFFNRYDDSDTDEMIGLSHSSLNFESGKLPNPPNFKILQFKQEHAKLNGHFLRFNID